MKKVTIEPLIFLRKKANNDLIKRMREGRPLNRYQAQDSWFPPRPVIQKDFKSISKLYSLRIDKKK